MSENGFWKNWGRVVLSVPEPGSIQIGKSRYIRREGRIYIQLFDEQNEKWVEQMSLTVEKVRQMS